MYRCFRGSNFCLIARVDHCGHKTQQTDAYKKRPNLKMIKRNDFVYSSFENNKKKTKATTFFIVRV